MMDIDMPTMESLKQPPLGYPILIVTTLLPRLRMVTLMLFEVLLGPLSPFQEVDIIIFLKDIPLLMEPIISITTDMVEQQETKYIKVTKLNLSKKGWYLLIPIFLSFFKRFIELIEYGHRFKAIKSALLFSIIDNQFDLSKTVRNVFRIRAPSKNCSYCQEQRSSYSPHKYPSLLFYYASIFFQISIEKMKGIMNATPAPIHKG
jgi:hypothetical protein